MKELDERKVYRSKAISAATDGACNMTRKENGLINLFIKQVVQCTFDFKLSLHYTPASVMRKNCFQIHARSNKCNKIDQLYICSRLKRKFQQLVLLSFEVLLFDHMQGIEYPGIH